VTTRHEDAGTVPSGYEIWLGGEIGPAAREAFSHLGIDTEPSCTVLVGSLAVEDLHRVLDAVRDLGLELIEIRSHRPPESAAPGSRGDG
jgi:hypothetical protein